MSAHDETRVIDCSTAMQQLWDYLDAELTPERMEAVRRHVGSCSACLPHHDFAKTFLDALGGIREQDHVVPNALKARVLTALKAAGYTPS
jgi:anti-sigma factor (TIGR02949 family)